MNYKELLIEMIMHLNNEATIKSLYYIVDKLLTAQTEEDFS